jgi:hypothetical protein
MLLALLLALTLVSGTFYTTTVTDVGQPTYNRPLADDDDYRSYNYKPRMLSGNVVRYVVISVVASVDVYEISLEWAPSTIEASMVLYNGRRSQDRGGV